MKNNKMIANLIIYGLVILITGCSTGNYQSNNKSTFIGKWRWVKNNESKDFTLDIKQKGKVLEGNYCYVFQNGAKMDCLVEGWNFQVEELKGKPITTKFKSGFDGSEGMVKLSFTNDGEVLWEVVESPKGEYYCPKKAVLILDN